jgi:hypothetical protein
LQKALWLELELLLCLPITARRQVTDQNTVAGRSWEELLLVLWALKSLRGLEVVIARESEANQDLDHGQVADMAITGS